MKNVVKTDQAPGAIGPYSQGIQVGLFSESIFAYAKKTRFCVFKIIIGSDFEKEKL